MIECKRQAVVYSKAGCPQCIVAKDLLAANNICYVEKMYGTDYSLEDLQLAVGHPVRSVPQIFLDGTHINTIQRLREALEESV
jgi:glutaredoxin 3